MWRHGKPERETVWKYVNPVHGKSLAHSLTGAPGRQNIISVFRAHRYAPSYVGLAGKELKAGKIIEDLQQDEAPESSTDVETR